MKITKEGIIFKECAEYTEICEWSFILWVFPKILLIILMMAALIFNHGAVK